MTETKKITDFSVSWEADHEQYWQGHGIAFSDYDECATGCGETLREAFEDALDSLAQNDLRFTDEQEKALVEDLVSQVKDPAMLDWSIDNPRSGYCDFVAKEDGTEDHQTEEHIEDCAVCAGDWHYYVNIDVKVE